MDIIYLDLFVGTGLDWTSLDFTWLVPGLDLSLGTSNWTAAWKLTHGLDLTWLDMWTGLDLIHELDLVHGLDLSWLDLIHGLDWNHIAGYTTTTARSRDVMNWTELNTGNLELNCGLGVDTWTWLDLIHGLDLTWYLNLTWLGAWTCLVLTHCHFDTFIIYHSNAREG